MIGKKDPWAISDDDDDDPTCDARSHPTKGGGRPAAQSRGGPPHAFAAGRAAAAGGGKPYKPPEDKGAAANSRSTQSSAAILCGQRVKQKMNHVLQMSDGEEEEEDGEEWVDGDGGLCGRPAPARGSGEKSRPGEPYKLPSVRKVHREGGRDDELNVRVGKGPAFRPREAGSGPRQQHPKGLGSHRPQNAVGGSSRNIAAPEKHRGPSSGSESGSDIEMRGKRGRRVAQTRQKKKLATSRRKVRRAASDSDDPGSDEYAPPARVSTHKQTSKGRGKVGGRLKDLEFEYPGSDSDEDNSLRVRPSVPKNGLSKRTKSKIGKGTTARWDSDDEDGRRPVPTPPPTKPKPNLEPLHLWDHRPAVGPMKDVQAIASKTVGPIKPPFLWSSKSDPETPITQVLWYEGNERIKLAGSIATLGEFIASFGGATNILRYPLQEIRNVLSSAGYRYWKKKTELIEDIYIPGVIKVDSGEGNSVIYRIVGFSEETDCLFFGHEGDLEEAVDQTDIAVQKLRDCEGLAEEKPVRKRRKKVVDEDEEEEAAARKAAKKQAAKEKSIKKTAPKGKGKGKGTGKGDCDGDDDGFGPVKIADPKLSLYLRKVPEPVQTLAHVAAAQEEDEDDGWVTA